MKAAGTAVLVTSANRGLGNALVEKALRRGAKRVYAAARQPFAQPDWRVIPLILEVTIAAQIEVRKSVESLDIVINNAGITLHDNLSDRAAMGQQLAVGLLRTYEVARAFLPCWPVRGQPSSMFYSWPPGRRDGRKPNLFQLCSLGIDRSLLLASLVLHAGAARRLLRFR